MYDIPTAEGYSEGISRRVIDNRDGTFTVETVSSLRFSDVGALATFIARGY
jgi:hypothetical protein